MYATGLPLAHDSAQATDAVNNFGGQRINSKSELQSGDIVYFGGSFGDFDHAGVYAGGGMMWDADIAYWVYPDGVHERTLASVENELRDGKLARFRQFIDTVKFAEVVPVPATN